MKRLTKLKRSVRAVSPVISVLLMIAIAVIASLVAYAWVVGYIGDRTDQTGKQIELQSYKTGTKIIYVQNTGQGTVHLSPTSSVYVNDVLRQIQLVDGKDVSQVQNSRGYIPINPGQTRTLEIDYIIQAGDKIKIVTVEGAVIEVNNPGTTGGSSSTGGTSGGGTTPTITSPTANFSFSPTSPLVDTTVQFTDTSASGSGTINQWSWNFGSGASPATSPERNPTTTYSTTGDKTVTLTITDSNSRTSTVSKTVTVAAQPPPQTPPTAEFTMSTVDPILQQTVQFTDASTAGSGTINQWSWNFGDGATSTQRNPTHAYSTLGQKTITLTVTDSNAKTSTVTHTLNVQDYIPPTANFVNSPATPTVGQLVQFTDSSTAGSGTINQWSWNLGSGATPATSTSQHPSATYSTSGTKTVTLQITDTNGKTSTVTKTVTVNPSGGGGGGGGGGTQTVQVTFTVSPAGSGSITSGTTTLSGTTQTYNHGTPITITAVPQSGYSFQSWTRNGATVFADDQLATTTATMLGSDTITANFIQSATSKLALTAGTGQILEKDQRSTAITVQRQDSSGNPINSGSTTVMLASTSSAGRFYATQSSNTPITQVTISSGSTVSFYYSDPNTGTPTLTVSSAGFASDQTTFSINLRYSTFDGSNWLYGFTAGSQPPWYRGVGIGVDGTNCAMSTTAQPQGDGPFTSDRLNTAGANIIIITFQYKLVNTDSRDTFELGYTTHPNPNLAGYQPGYFTYFASIDTTQNVGQWQTYTTTITKDPGSDNFQFRFWTDLYTPGWGGSRSPVAQILVDNVIITVA